MSTDRNEPAPLKPRHYGAIEVLLLLLLLLLVIVCVSSRMLSSSCASSKTLQSSETWLVKKENTKNLAITNRPHINVTQDRDSIIQ